MPWRNLVSWNTMIAGCLHNDIVEKACQLFDQMAERDIFTWTQMITCYTRNEELEKARSLFNSMPDKMNPGCSRLLECYDFRLGRNGQTMDARNLFDEQPVKNAVSSNAMIAAYI
ncbi:hypothetical protein L2E82_14210 [Cichorium intybus]|uniref:Uncharacterized protein n=1 Tax=Cichorium intybus TaxID=13427 RepID=A0ACB9EZQ6_CICIN|nr:hypothetical protein L2E82_14210 [Cichorium intybus]